VWQFEVIYYVAMKIFKEKGGEGDVRDYSEREAGLGGPGPSGEPFEEDEEHLARRYLADAYGVLGVSTRPR
jgi:hypothetical protein